MISFPIISLFSKREVLFQFSWHNIKSRHAGTYFGILWTMLEPLLLFLLMYVVFTTIRARGDENFAMYLLTGIVLYHTFVKGTTIGMMSLRGNKNILQSINMNKEFFPVSSILTTSIQLVFRMIVFFALMPFFTFVPPFTIIFFPLLLGLLLILILGISYILSIVSVKFRDIQTIWAVVMFGLFFLTPIIWFVDKADDTLLLIHQYNPLGQLVEIGHKLMFNEIPDVASWAYVSIFCFGIFFAGFYFFKKSEKNLVEVL